MTSDPRYFNSVNTQNPHDYSTGYTTNIVNRIDAGDDNETFAVGGLVANFENSSLNETPHNNRHRRTFRTAKATGNHFPLSPQGTFIDF